MTKSNRGPDLLRWLGGVFIMTGIGVEAVLFVLNRTGRYPFDLHNDITLAFTIIGFVFIANGLFYLRTNRKLRRGS